MQTTTKPKKSGCGCSGSTGGKGCGCGGNCGAGCGCKPARLPEAAAALCSPCETASFVRPRFFAGQLLTEDDLSALIDYVVSKNRFHNSRLFGEGVVCGLLVECGPCEGQVVVDPGYALDCCGNDLVLTCKQILDLAPMIRELARHKDCGCTDPCAEPTVSQTSLSTSEDAQKTPPPCRTYCLYARYGERPDQPVAAYPVDGNCDAASCEPTRIVEGITFELRCPTKVHHPNIHDAYACCDDDDSKYIVKTGMALQVLSALAGHSVDREKAIPAVQLKQLHEALAYEDLTVGVHGADRAILLSRFVGVVGGILGRARRLNIDLEGTGLTTEQLTQITGHVKHAVQELAKHDVDELEPLDAAIVRALQPESGEGRARATAHSFPEIAWSTELMTLVRDQLETVAIKLQASAGCGTQKVHTDCCLRDTIDYLKPGFRAIGDDFGEVKRLGESASRASDAIWRWFNDCDCAAVNPPCPPCDDPGVLLACIEVDHCKVVSICNSVREYVYAPSTLRYWDAIETPPTWLCCGRHRRGIIVDPIFGHAALRRHEDRVLAVRAGLAMHVEAPSLRALAAPAVTSKQLAAPHELELTELRRQIAALERKVNQLKPDKIEKKGDRS